MFTGVLRSIFDIKVSCQSTARYALNASPKLLPVRRNLRNSPPPHPQSCELRCPTVRKASQAICSEEILYFSMNAALSDKKIFKISSIRQGASGFALVDQVLGLATIEMVNQNLPQQVFYEKTPCPAQLLSLM